MDLTMKLMLVMLSVQLVQLATWVSIVLMALLLPSSLVLVKLLVLE